MKLRLAVGTFLFFVSGFTALLYQVVWQRLLGLFSGADVYAATIIVAAFMAGLGCGGLAGGAVADRLAARASLLTFAAAELAVGLFGFFSAFLYYDVLYLRFGEVAAPAVVMPVVLFISLLWPTFFMGMSLPLLARALTDSLERAPVTIGLLYGLNALGASAGALLTTWWLLPAYGLDGSLQISAVLNIAVALVAAALSRMAGGEDVRGAAGAPVHSEHPEPGDRLTYPMWIAMYGASGFLALSLEIVWFRTVAVIAKSTAFTFGTLLAVYLGGLGLGASAGSLVAGRVRRPAMVFLFLQASIGIYVGASVIRLLSALDDAGWAWLREHLGHYDPIDLRQAILDGRAEVPWLYFGIPILLIGIPTFLMGVGFPLLQKAVQTDFRRLGTRVGVLMLANIAGSTLGAIVTGWLALRFIGTAGTLKATVAAAGAYAAIGLLLSLRSPSKGRAWLGATAAAVLAIAFLVPALPTAQRFWAGLHAAPPNRVVYGEDETGVSLLKLAPGSSLTGGTEVYLNGVGQSWLPYGDVHTLLGALPAFVHPNPRDVAIIGLGSGDTVFATAGRREIERIVCIEIVRSQRTTLLEFDRVYGYRGLKMLFADPRVEHVIGDGRLYAMRTGRRFDIIEADALRPGSAYSGNLYSERYFMLLRDRLKPGGLAVTWAPTPRIKRTFLKVFPHVIVFGDVLLGSREPIDGRADLIRKRLADQSVRDYYEEAGVDIRALVDRVIDQPERLGEGYDRTAIDDINTDLFPRDEFDVPAITEWGSRRVTN